ncbi:MAG: hypothetical protein ACJ77Z_13690 [Thermoleophilaceae bacterium]|jgi:heme/copper-type cytochrome/quinol oxidase subunit 2
MRRRPLGIAVAIAFAAIWIGLLGAWAFNPDDGAVAHAEPLWRVFGITAYLGAFAIPVLAVTSVFALGVRAVDACRRRHAV